MVECGPTQEAANTVDEDANGDGNGGDQNAGDQSVPDDDAQVPIPDPESEGPAWFKCWSVDMRGTSGAWRTHGALGGTTGDGVPTAVMFAPQRSRFSKPMRLLFTRGKEVVDSRKPPRLRSSCEPKPDER